MPAAAAAKAMPATGDASRTTRAEDGRCCCHWCDQPVVMTGEAEPTRAGGAAAADSCGGVIGDHDGAAMLTMVSGGHHCMCSYLVPLRSKLH